MCCGKKQKGRNKGSEKWAEMEVLIAIQAIVASRLGCYRVMSAFVVLPQPGSV